MPHGTNKMKPQQLLDGHTRHDVERLLAAEHHEPHRVLGAHPVDIGGQRGVIVRAMDPDASAAEVLLPQGGRVEMTRCAGGLFAAFIADAGLPLRYRLCWRYPDGATWEAEDPYRFLPTLGDLDLHLFNEGNHRRLWRHLGAHPRTVDSVAGVSFAVWAPNARRVSVVGDFCHWDGRRYPMRQMGASGVFEIFLPQVKVGDLYKFEIKTAEGDIRIKTDPFAFAMERPPSAASRVAQSRHVWGDKEWMIQRRSLNHAASPMAIYEVHLGSWARVPEEDFRTLNYREIAPRLVQHIKRFGFTHIELMPVAEHPFTGSWGYQVTGYYAPTSWYGAADDFRYFVDYCHQNGVGVIMDWVPAHFPKDDFALRRFDGTALYEHDDPRLGEHPDWGTLIFNYGRNEVRNFLVANALFWLEEFHIDGLRVDAVASMLYLDYSRGDGEWVPNRLGGRENLEAIDFLKNMNRVVHEEQPGCFTVAEESTAWPGVTRVGEDGGLGFTFKWNMGWMHDTLVFFSKDPVHRRFHHDQLTFAMLYEYTERFIMPLSHDEVVHGKRSLLEKMPGDLWQKFANLRLLLAYQFTRPGKKLLFMGSELAPHNEWNHDSSLDWHLAADSWRGGLASFMEDLGRIYHENSSLWAADHDPTGYVWIDCTDRENSVLSYWRRAQDNHVIVVLNLTPVPRDNYRIGVPFPNRYVRLLSSDEARYSGSGYQTPQILLADHVGWHGFPQSLNLQLPPLSALIFQPSF